MPRLTLSYHSFHPKLSTLNNSKSYLFTVLTTKAIEDRPTDLHLRAVHATRLEEMIDSVISSGGAAATNCRPTAGHVREAIPHYTPPAANRVY